MLRSKITATIADITGTGLQIYWQKKLLVVLLLGFSSGLPRLLVASTLAAMLTDNNIEMAAIGLFAYVALPYSFNFLWAPLADNWNITFLTKRFGKRRGWILFNQIALVITISIMAILNPQHTPAAVAVAALLISFFSASQDIGIDAFRAEYLNNEQYGAGATMAVLGYRIAMLMSGAGALYLADIFGWKITYITMAACMLVGVAVILMVQEPAHSHNGEPDSTAKLQQYHNMGWIYSMRQYVMAPFQDFSKRFPDWIWLLIFILFYRLSDGFIGFMTTAFFMDIGFDKTTIASIAKLFGFGATMLGMFVGGIFIAKFGLFHALWSFAILQLLANLAYINLALTGENIVALGVAIIADNISGGMVTTSAIAFMMHLCQNRKYTATQYALLSSLASLGSITLAGSAGWIAQTYGWHVMFGLSAVLGLPCLLIFWKKRSSFAALSK